jgi:nitrate/nitrite transporter NarK
VIAGGPAPLIAAALLQSTGSSVGISWYIVACAVISFIALVLMPRRRSADVEPGLVAEPQSAKA